MGHETRREELRGCWGREGAGSGRVPRVTPFTQKPSVLFAPHPQQLVGGSLGTPGRTVEEEISGNRQGGTHGSSIISLHLQTPLPM